ncbi:MAG: sulfite exporter TauE/SafE family protein [Candidatus Latescibacterota bacterium]|nr:sulfite exporter TauE/SafE family protein [Candidatus Latescibacterota bacterium]
MFPEYSIQVWFCATTAVVLMGIAKAGFGGGIGLIATPLLALVLPVSDAAALMLPLLIACDGFAVRHYIRSFDSRSIKRLLPGALVGVSVGTFFFTFFGNHEQILRVGLGVLALLFVMFQIGRNILLDAIKRYQPGTVEGLLMGAFSGFTSTIAHAGAPPIIIYLLPQNLPRAQFVGTTVIFFALLNLIKVPPYWVLGLFHVDIFKLTLLLSPLAYIGVRFGVFLNKQFSDVWFNRVVYGLLVLTAIQLITNKVLFFDLF